MKKLTMILSIMLTVLCTTSCGNNENKSSASDTTDHVSPTTIPENSDATNPSLADTAYSDSVHH